MLGAVFFGLSRDYIERGTTLPETDGAVQGTTTESLLAGLAKLAQAGIRAVVIIGKVKTIAPKTSQAGVITMKAEVVCGEGDSITLKWPQGAAVPGVHQQGAFLCDRPTEYMNKASANCVAFSAA